jgi:thymidylate kinase
LLVALSGPSGSGKTTIAFGLKRALSEKGYNACIVQGCSYFLIRVFHREFIRESAAQPRRHMSTIRARVRTLWLLAVLLDSFAFAFYLQMLKRRHLVLMDRYFHDFTVIFRLRGFLGTLFLMLPRPDLSIILSIDPEVALARKSKARTLSLEDYHYQEREYLLLAQKIHAPVFRGSAPVQQLVETILQMLPLNA